MGKTNAQRQSEYRTRYFTKKERIDFYEHMVRSLEFALRGAKKRLKFLKSKTAGPKDP